MKKLPLIGVAVLSLGLLTACGSSSNSSSPAKSSSSSKTLESDSTEIMDSSVPSSSSSTTEPSSSETVEPDTTETMDSSVTPPPSSTETPTPPAAKQWLNDYKAFTDKFDAFATKFSANSSDISLTSEIPYMTPEQFQTISGAKAYVQQLAMTDPESYDAEPGSPIKLSPANSQIATMTITNAALEVAQQVLNESQNYKDYFATDDLAECSNITGQLSQALAKLGG